MNIIQGGVGGQWREAGGTFGILGNIIVNNVDEEGWRRYAQTKYKFLCLFTLLSMFNRFFYKFK